MASPRRTHRVHRTPAFTVRYWAVVLGALGLPLAALVVLTAGTDGSLSATVALPWVATVTVGALILWRWRAHRLEITDGAVVERCHPLLVYRRRRALDEVTEVVPCPPDRLRMEHGESSLLLRCTCSGRDLVVSPANPQQFLDDLAAADARLVRYRTRVVRAAAGGGRARGS